MGIFTTTQTDFTPDQIAIFIKFQEIPDLTELNKKLEEGYMVEEQIQFSHGMIFMLSL